MYVTCRVVFGFQPKNINDSTLSSVSILVMGTFASRKLAQSEAAQCRTPRGQLGLKKPTGFSVANRDYYPWLIHNLFGMHLVVILAASPNLRAVAFEPSLFWEWGLW